MALRRERLCAGRGTARRHDKDIEHCHDGRHHPDQAHRLARREKGEEAGEQRDDGPVQMITIAPSGARG